MIGYLVDTNVISEFVKPVPNEGRSLVSTGRPKLHVRECRHDRGNPTGNRKQTKWKTACGIGDLAGSRFARLVCGESAPITREIADRWGRLTILAKRNGKMLSTMDGLLAATANVHGLMLVTRNIKDFTGLGVQLLDPWNSSTN